MEGSWSRKVVSRLKRRCTVIAIPGLTIYQVVNADLLLWRASGFLAERKACAPLSMAWGTVLSRAIFILKGHQWAMLLGY